MTSLPWSKLERRRAAPLPPAEEGTVKALTAQRFLDAKPQLQTGGKLTGSRKIRIRISCDISITMIHTDLRGVFKLASLRLFDFATRRMDIVRLIVLIGLACLIWLDPSWSMPGGRVHKSLIENLGRVLWGTSYGSSAAARRSVDAFGITGDTYWEDNSVCFPSAWPDTCGLPIIVRDLDALPKKGIFQACSVG